MEKLQPKIMRLDRDIELIAPPGYHASVLLKLVEDGDGHCYYSWWALAGRHAADQATVLYKHTGENVIRFDVPEEMPLSAESLRPHLRAFLASEQVVVTEEVSVTTRARTVVRAASDPPIIRD